MSASLKNIPLRAFSDFQKFNLKNILSALKNFPYFLRSVSSHLPNINNPEYRAIINELLFITAQNNVNETPMLMGSMGLNYPSDTGYVMGGMKVFSETLAKNCSHLFYRHQVIAISPINSGKDGVNVLTSKGQMSCKKLVSTLPIWNHEKLFENDRKIQAHFKNNESSKKIEDCWSAFTVYMTIPVNDERQSLYYQIHCDPIPNCGTHSFFVSLSHPEDRSRTLNPDRQTVTISTHTKSKDWLGLPPLEYKKRKDETSNFILEVMCQHFALRRDVLQDIVTGSPSTFIKYTKRAEGLVGGIPHSISRGPLKLILNFSPLDNFYLIGDTQFPGQGIGAVVLGAQNLAHHFS